MMMMLLIVDANFCRLWYCVAAYGIVGADVKFCCNHCMLSLMLLLTTLLVMLSTAVCCCCMGCSRLYMLPVLMLPMVAVGFAVACCYIIASWNFA
jgi:hypothetical protein